jgi:hypothetical protein
MNKTEQKALEYLKLKGAKQIQFNSHNTIDFTTDLGLFEVKTSVNKGIMFTFNQIKFLNGNSQTEVHFLVYEQNTDTPLELSFKELKKQFKIWFASPNNPNFTTLGIRKDTASELIKIKGELQAKRGQTVNQDDVVQELVRCWRDKK